MDFQGGDVYFVVPENTGAMSVQGQVFKPAHGVVKIPAALAHHVDQLGWPRTHGGTVAEVHTKPQLVQEIGKPSSDAPDTRSLAERLQDALKASGGLGTTPVAETGDAGTHQDGHENGAVGAMSDEQKAANKETLESKVSRPMIIDKTAPVQGDSAPGSTVSASQLGDKSTGA